MAHHHHELGSLGNRRRSDREDGLARHAVLGLVAGDGPARLVVGGLLGFALGHRGRGELGDRPARLVEVGFGFGQRDVGGLAVGGLEADLEGAEHEIPVEGSPEALVRQGVVGQGFQADRGQHGTGRGGFDHVGLLVSRASGHQPGAVVEPLEFRVLLGRDLLFGQRVPGHADLGDGRALLGQPGRVGCGLVRRNGLQRLLRGGQLGRGSVDLLLLFFGRERQQGRRVAPASRGAGAAEVPEHARLVVRVEVGEHLVEFFLRDRVVFVVVAAAAVHREPHPGRARGLDAIDDVLGEPFLDDAASFAVEAMVAVEGRGHDLIARGVREQVAGELLDREGVEGLVVVESLDDPVAVGPHRALRVALEAVGVGVAGEVEPLSRHMFAVIGRGQQAVEGLGPGLG